MMTPVLAAPMREHPARVLSRAAEELQRDEASAVSNTHPAGQLVRSVRLANRDLLPPVVRVQTALHPWVAFGIMPLFALANAGVSMKGLDLALDGALFVVLGVSVALVAGKPLGVIGMTWLMVKLGWCRLPSGVSWAGVCIVGLLAGIGFTMSIFIALLAFTDDNLLSAAKLGVLLGSLAAALIGIGVGRLYVRRLRD
jgi:NhaA family Na+:H+ antiporter